MARLKQLSLHSTLHFSFVVHIALPPAFTGNHHYTPAAEPLKLDILDMDIPFFLSSSLLACLFFIRTGGFIVREMSHTYEDEY